MTEDSRRKRYDNDHDILIELTTRFDLFMQTEFPNLIMRIDSFMELVRKKADVEDLRHLQSDMHEVEKRVSVLEGQHQEARVRKDTLINVGNMGWRGWTIIISVVTGIAAIMKLL